jgi:hypothetical protein
VDIVPPRFFLRAVGGMLDSRADARVHREQSMADMQPTQTPAQRNVITDIDIPFGRLIVIFVKFGLAAIPAAIIIAIIWALIAVVLTAIFGAGMWSTGMFHMGGPGTGI